MRKNILNWMTILMIALVNVCFVSCGDEEDDTLPRDTIIGKWKMDVGSTGYYLLAFHTEYNGNELVCEEYDHAQLIETIRYKYYYNSVEKILRINYSNGPTKYAVEVISLTSDQLILKDWPYEGNNSFIRLTY